MDQYDRFLDIAFYIFASFGCINAIFQKDYFLALWFAAAIIQITLEKFYLK